MRTFTVMAGPHPAAPVLVRDDFSWPAFFLPLPWLLWRRLWLPALAYAALAVALALIPRAWPLTLALHLLIGLHAADLRRWRLARRGFHAVHVVAAPDDDAALARLLHHRPDLEPVLARAELAPRGSA